MALHIYFAPNNTETRFKIVDTAAQVRWQKYSAHDLMAEWRDIKIKVDRAKEVRNRITHGEIEILYRKIKGKRKHQALLTASSFDIGRRWKENKPGQWPGMSLHDIRATADSFYWLALRIEEMRDYWRDYSLRQHDSLPQRFARIVERRLNSGPLSDDLKHPEPKDRP